ncbi:Armadillo-like helical [Penicillium capsulatum]|uniref:Armadillo-like helical n=1 Tax=Penicillium capsulatum TaxID=69766 RepID=A0A9W9IBN1_9EURO|nr:Armadillo-like helical [Penicillium capsulatum]KAJ6136394.1 Armadillo-like helical [Penicillium capsulatum]
MDNQRQESFQRLRTPCIELSSAGLRFRGNQASAPEVTRALEPVYRVLEDLAAKNALDEKFAEYAFFPLSHIFNETQRLPARCLELAVQCLQLLVEQGWRQKLSPVMGKQLVILLTLIVGGSPNKVDGKQTLKPQAPEELSIAGFNCLGAIFDMLDGPVAKSTIFHEIGTATVVDQTVYILLEGLVDERSDDLCFAAANALRALYVQITDRVVLASIMPRTVSALAKVIRPTTQARRSYRFLQTSIQILTHLLKAVLNDRVVASTEQAGKDKPSSDKIALDASWLKATATQIKLALANVIQVRRHQRIEVQSAILQLCVMVVEDCPRTLAEAIPMMVETIVVLADKEEEESNEAYKTLVHLATTYLSVLDSLKENLHSWLTSFPRIMQSNDETAKQRGIQQISTAFQILTEVQSRSDLLTSSLASGLCDSMSVVVKHDSNSPQPLDASEYNVFSLDVLSPDSKSSMFPPVLLEHRSQEKTLKDLRAMITKLNLSESGNDITRLIVNRLQSSSDESIAAPFWLALTSLRAQSQAMTGIDDFLVDDQMEQSQSLSNRSGMVEELYYISLNILTELPADGSGDWRTSALALEAVALQAQQLGEGFRPELMDALYPTLQLLASSNPALQRHAMTCLNILTASCNYPDTSSMIIENVDYLVNSVSLKLTMFDVSPYPPQVLFMMVKLCGAQLIPYLDDVIDSVFGILNLYHGYPRLVEMMFKTLGAVVEEGSSKKALLTIDSGREGGMHSIQKPRYQNLSISTIAADIAARKTKRARTAEEDLDVEDVIPHPKKPWSETRKPEREPESISELLNKIDSDEPLPPPKEPEDTEKPLSKTHSLLLHVVKSIPLHLSSPSPYLRRALLAILINVLPTLSLNENSFLPLINDLWPPVASRVIFPSSVGGETTSKSLTTQSLPGVQYNSADTANSQDETFVTTTACQAIEAMCKGAGDFMASRIEPEFPRWERLYQRVWSKVREDAEAANERRARQTKQQIKAASALVQSIDTAPESHSGLAVTPSLALSPTTPGSRAFTPHHNLWRALISLFITVLSYVRLPLEVGDQICEILGAWITLFVGPAYYFHDSRRGSSASVNDSQREMVQSAEEAIQAMESWNADLTWFIFVRQSRKMNVPPGKSTLRTGTVTDMKFEIGGEEVRFAAVVC